MSPHFICLDFRDLDPKSSHIKWELAHFDALDDYQLHPLISGTLKKGKFKLIAVQLWECLNFTAQIGVRLKMMPGRGSGPRRLSLRGL